MRGYWDWRKGRRGLSRWLALVVLVKKIEMVGDDVSLKEKKEEEEKSEGSIKLSRMYK